MSPLKKRSRLASEQKSSLISVPLKNFFRLTKEKS